MDRRRFVTSLGAAPVTVPGLSHSQLRSSARVGWVGGWYTVTAANGIFEAFRQGMRDLGYIEGKTIAIAARWMEGTAPDEAARLRIG